MVFPVRRSSAFHACQLPDSLPEARAEHTLYSRLLRHRCRFAAWMRIPDITLYLCWMLCSLHGSVHIHTLPQYAKKPWTGFYMLIQAEFGVCACRATVRTVISQTLHVWLLRTVAAVTAVATTSWCMLQNCLAWGWKWWTTWATTLGWDCTGTFFVKRTSWAEYYEY